MSHITPHSPPNPANTPSSRFFGNIGIGAGMRILDVGCGNGDLSRLVASLTGPSGEVVAIDRSQQAIAMAQRMDANPLAAHIHYCTVDLASELPDLGQFDAIVGRRVLMYLPDAVATLERLAALARPGATLAFQEHARTSLPAGLGDIPLHRQLYDWTWRTVAAEGGDVALAFRLAKIMQALGLTVEDARSEAILLHSSEPSFLPTLAEVMLPRAVECGIARTEELDVATLDQRIEEEARSVDGAIVWDLAFLISARKESATG
ncbi:class I SAM-dependent methyltransferase [Novosphingobium gossypii]|uniref:class I SAM-dependent methyltransferase n=1 Tax=Novosphingobium gossypii TaxID=1604774 RepID=UPI003D1CEF5E